MNADADTLGLVTISELARLRGVDKSAISRRVTRMEEQGLIATRAGKGGVKLVNHAEFDRVAGATVDAVRELNGRGASAAAASGSAGGSPGDPVLAREQARRAAYDADLKQLDLQERLGLLIPAESVREAMTNCGHALARTIDQLHTRADDMAAAVGRDGVQGARALLKTLARELRDDLARAMTMQAEGDEQPPAAVAASAEAGAA